MNRVLRGMLVLAVWLVIGAVITVVVAWGAVRGWDNKLAQLLAAARGVGPIAAWPSTERFVPKVWPIAVPEDWPAPQGATIEQHAAWADMWVTGGSSSHGAPCSTLEVSFGWPCYALRAECWNDRRGPTPQTSAAPWTVQSPWVKKYLGISMLPLRPLWPGFATNTLLYAALAWGLWQVPLLLRRRHRRARNRCLRCGYSLAGLAAGAPCPECGGTQVGSGKSEVGSVGE